MSKLSAKLKEELEAVVPPVIFFFVALHIVALVRTLMLEGTGIPVNTAVSITVAALILGKAVLLADHLPIINRYPQKPLMYNIIWKTAIYTLVSIFIHYLERLFDFWRHTGSIAGANRKLLAEMVWAHFLAVQIILVVMIFSYCTMRELIRVIGRRRVMEIFFRTPPATPA
jgi:hypothetical protein